MTTLTARARIAGVDEAGRGPLAGPVVAAAVILDPARPVDGLMDSKALSAQRRAQLATAIKERALVWAVAAADVTEIERLNILHASLSAMTQAVAALELVPEHCLIDGNRCPAGLPCSAEAVVKGDASIGAISAAAILAKESRDAQMRALDDRYPGYGFADHKGYPTRSHLAALRRFGPCPAHRRAFAPVRAVLDDAAQGVLADL